MQPFPVHQADSAVHTPTSPCPACAPGYPVPCPRITGGALQPTGFDEAGQSTGSAWTVTSCPGTQHAELGPTGGLELRCAACGVPP